MAIHIRKELWDYVPASLDEQRLAEGLLAEELRLHPLVALMLVRRGMVDADVVRGFLYPALPALHDPFLLCDMDRAVERLNLAIIHQERIMVFGDYDADGITAVSIVYEFISQYTSNIKYRIPVRERDGYGISVDIIDEAHVQGITLIIVLDCGVKAVEETRYAAERGIDLIICDHHQPGGVLPAAVAVIDAKREDSVYPYGDLSGCGVGFKLMQAFALSNNIRFNRLVPLLDRVAVSIVADMVPVTGENRILLWHGLKQMNYNPCVGIKAICEVSGEAESISVGDVGYRIVPRINASGRIHSGEESVSILIERDLERARAKARLLDEYNDTRRDIDKETTEEANGIVEGLTDLLQCNSIVLYKQEWHVGVIGIVSARVAELYCRPTVVIAQMGALVCGSARSVDGFDIHKALEYCSEYLVAFGGHPYAAGFTMDSENIPAFTEKFEQYVSDNLQRDNRRVRLQVDAEIDFKDITLKLAQDIARMSPFGTGNEEPVFLTRRVYDYGTSKIIGRYQEHIKLELVDSKSNRIMNCIAFGKGQQWTQIRTKRAFDICYRIRENSHRKGEVQLHIEAIQPNEEG